MKNQPLANCLCSLLLATVALLYPKSASADQEWKAVFNPFQVLTLHLEMTNGDWDRVRNDQPSQSESWVPQIAEAQMWGEGETPIRVTVRRKGESDIPLPEGGSPQKVSLKIDINALVPGQKWRGLTKLSLENGGPSPLCEGFSWILHRRAWEAGIYGYEAAYSGWVRLFINGELKGVLVNAEQRNGEFLKNHGYDKGPSTWLYKVDGTSSLEVGIGDSPANQHLCFAPFSSGPGHGGGEGCTQPNLEADLPQWINMRGFLTLGAVEAFLENKDGLFTHSGKNSYAVDFDPPYPNTRLYFPWDQDSTIFEGNASIYGNESYQQQLLRHPWFSKVYEQLMRDLLDGPFSTNALFALLDQLEAGIGAAFDEDPYVYESGSADAFQNLRQWVATRVPNVRSQLTQPWLPRPVFNQPGGEVIIGFNLTMSAPTGMIYYTLDGTDPRAIGGGVSPTAQAYTAPVLIDRTTHVIARAYDGSVWSPLPATATFNIARYASALRITELMYHPAYNGVPGNEDYFEFLELKNTGTIPLNLSGFYFEGITYTFPPGTILGPSSFYVLARSQGAMSNRYPGVTVHGVYTGKLDDGGEKIRLRNADGNTIISVEYDDDPPWPLSPDGLGYSLVLAEPNGDPDRPETWRASSRLHGSPGADDPEPSYGLGVVINEVLPHSNSPFEDAIELVNLGSQPVDISGWFLSDDFVKTNAADSYQLKKYQIPPDTVIPPGGFAVVYEDAFRTNNPGVPFALTEYGETVYLSAANSNGDLLGYVVGATFGASDSGVSWGRYPTSRDVDFVPLSRPTFGVDFPGDLDEFRIGTGAPNAPPLVGPVVINEIMYNPTGGGSEFLELLNISSAPVEVSGWKIEGTGFVFPTNTILPPQGLVLLLNTNHTTVPDFRASNTVPSAVPIFGYDFVLENEGEALRLEKPNSDAGMPAIQVERIRYNDKSPWPTEADGAGPSLERYAASAYGNDPVNWRTVSAGGSPGRLNRFHAGVAVSKQSAWNYFGLGNNLGTAWRELVYSSSSWPSGDGVLGYGAPGLKTIVDSGPNPANKPITVYFRKEFVINDPIATISNLHFKALYDDGFVLYLNGTEILRSASMPAGPIAFDTPASASYNSVGYEDFDLSANISLLRLGNNVLCAEVHQVDPGSEDLLWDAALTYQVSTQPTMARPTMAPDGGYFTGPVQVFLSTEPADGEIYYTLNGTDPDQSATRYTGSILIDTTAELRARAYRSGYNESELARATFVLGIQPLPPVLSIQRAEPGQIQLTVTGSPQQAYIIEASTNLLDWSAISTNTAASDGRAIYLEQTTEAQRFFRAQPR